MIMTGKTNHRSLGIALFALTVCATAPLLAKDGPQQHAGFYLRLSSGMGLAGTSQNGATEDASLFGLSGMSLPIKRH